MSRIGLLGGAFDPPHRGHVDFARQAQQALGLEQVWLVPTYAPPHRPGAHECFEHRLRLLAAAIAPYPELAVESCERELPAPSYSLHTLRHLHQRNPEHQWFWLVGADAKLSSWHGWPQHLEHAHFVIAPRAGLSVAADLPRGTWTALSSDVAPWSSSAIRHSIANADTELPQQALAPAVWQLIQQERWYQR